MMNINNSIADFYFRGKNKNGEKELKANAGLNTEIVGIEFYQVIRFSCRCVGGKVVLIVRATQHIEPEIIHAVRQEFYLQWESEQDRFDLFGSDRFLAGWKSGTIREIFVREHQLRENNPEFKMRAEIESMHTCKPKTTSVFGVDR